ncbi:hypothetical protein LUCX_149 [Xanthomonas phage vB_XciM_LucasX]|nr:hypothetical protein LUCX_149 [Xanthomonas phage vB_XciM_LucasX]
MNNINDQLVEYLSHPLNIGVARAPFSDMVCTVPGSELDKLWDHPTGYPVGLLELSYNELTAIFFTGQVFGNNNRSLCHVSQGENGRVEDHVSCDVRSDKREGMKVSFRVTRRLEQGWCNYGLSARQLVVEEANRTSLKNRMTFRPFMDKEGKPQWQLMRREILQIESYPPAEDTVPAYLNYLYKNLERTIGDALKVNEDGYLVETGVDGEIQCWWEDVVAEMIETGLQHHPLGVYNYIPTDPSLIDWFFEVKAQAANGAFDHTTSSIETVSKRIADVGTRFAELTEPFVQKAARENRALAREIKQQDEHGSPLDEEDLVD